MKKVFLSVALSLAVVGSWAFYPKAAAPTTGSHMMVIGNFTLNGFTADANVTTITAEGQMTEKPVEVKIRSAEKVAAGFVEVQKVALAKVNELSQAGWHVVSAAPNNYSRGGTTFVVQTVYMLEKR
ncbi:hypothetical protein ACVWYF_004587 [Hymenobacter sp. UYAg731]